MYYFITFIPNICVVKEIEFILYIENQQVSKVFYEKLLLQKPILDVPGMTEFQLAENVKLGLMPNNGIAKIIGQTMPHPKKGAGIPRCELYLKVDDAQQYINRGLQAGAKLISALQPRDWGDTAGYIADLDGHIIAFAK